ncbi:MAG: alpha/beta hydrolase [Saprospiraceae bacterium]|nr:alpha/beta hydrolase [Candidatus Vicinibacter affinis]
MRRFLFFFLLCLIEIGFLHRGNLMAQTDTIPDFRNEPYGPDVLQNFNLWLSQAGKGPRPLVIFFHGGAFRAGDKEIEGRQVELMQTFLSRGISFASANYRLSHTTRLDSILMDGERLIRFLKLNAHQFNIDPAKIGVYGSSAGACMALWIGVTGKDADSLAADPLLRQSTHVQVAGHISAPATMDLAQWANIVHLDSNWFDSFGFVDDLAFYRISHRDMYWHPDIVALRKYLDLPNYVDAGDPPVYYYNQNPNQAPRVRGDVTHHVLHAYYLDSISRIRSHQHVFNDNPNADLAYTEMADYFCTYLNCEASAASEMVPSDVSIYSYTSAQEVLLAVNSSVNLENLVFSIIDLLGREFKIEKGLIQFKSGDNTNYVMLNMSSINPINQISFIRVLGNGKISCLPLLAFRRN